jgi:type I restriction enzyme S subunit
MKLPPSWNRVLLKQIIIDTQPGFAQRPEGGKEVVPQIRTHNVSPDGQIDLNGIKFVKPSDAELEKYRLSPGDVVFNNTNSEEWVGKTALFSEEGVYVFSNHMTRIRADRDKVDPEYLARYLQYLWKMGYSRQKSKRWVNQAAVEQEVLWSFKIVLPSLAEQIRIVTILKQADEIRRLRREVIEEAQKLYGALFLEMFGDPRENKLGWHRKQLGVICRIAGGGTPSSNEPEYWKGDIPWVSPKDFTSNFIEHSEDHISLKALQESATQIIPANSVLIVTRSGILRHTVPCALNTIEVAINQDIKAFIPIEDVNSTFLMFQMHTLAAGILKRVRVGATVHNLETDYLSKLQIILPPIERQAEYSRRVIHLRSLIQNINTFQIDLETMWANMASAAFSGDLTASWRDENMKDLQSVSRKLDEAIGIKRNIVTIKEFAPEHRPWMMQTERMWMKDQMSELQYEVWSTIRSWKGTVIPSEHLDEFVKTWTTEHLENAKEQVIRALNQLAGLGLIAKISIPNEDGEYVTGFRGFREEELSRTADLEALVET